MLIYALIHPLIPFSPLRSLSHNQVPWSTLRKRGVIPPSFPGLLDTGLDRITQGLSQVEIRAFALSPVANPVLQVILGLKPRGSFEEGEDSFLNKLLMGFIVQPEGKWLFSPFPLYLFLPSFLICPSILAYPSSIPQVSLLRIDCQEMHLWIR